MNGRKLMQSLLRNGKGLHSGEACVLSIEPSDEGLSLELRNPGDSGRIRISRLGLEGGGRGSDLIFPDGTRVRTCEHVLSALAGLGIWYARLIVEGPEMPALDGCAVDLTRELMAKSEPFSGNPEPLKLQSPVHVGDTSRFVVALPSPSFHVTYMIDYEAAPIGTQVFDYAGTPEDYLDAVAPARTFAMKEDIEKLRASGLALGGSLDNAILVGKTDVETTGGLRFPDEFVRHKTLDLLGDLANLGTPLAAHVVAVRAGHVQHLQLVERLRKLSREA